MDTILAFMQARLSSELRADCHIDRGATSHTGNLETSNAIDWLNANVALPLMPVYQACEMPTTAATEPFDTENAARLQRDNDAMRFRIAQLEIVNARLRITSDETTTSSPASESTTASSITAKAVDMDTLRSDYKKEVIANADKTQRLLDLEKELFAVKKGRDEEYESYQSNLKQLQSKDAMRLQAPYTKRLAELQMQNQHLTEQLSAATSQTQQVQTELGRLRASYTIQTQQVEQLRSQLGGPSRRLVPHQQFQAGYRGGHRGGFRNRGEPVIVPVTREQ